MKINARYLNIAFTNAMFLSSTFYFIRTSFIKVKILIRLNISFCHATQYVCIKTLEKHALFQQMSYNMISFLKD